MENFKKYLKRIEAGELQWCYKVGECYELGSGVEKSFEKAFEWYKKGATIRKYTSLLVPKKYGIIINKDEFKEIIDYIYWLAQRYLTGDGIEQSFNIAIRLFKICSLSSSTSDSVFFSRVYLGTIYEYGLGVKRNYLKATEYYLLSTVKFSNPFMIIKRPLVIRALSKLGYIYEYGLGVQRSTKAAFEWYKKASYVKYESQFF